MNKATKYILVLGYCILVGGCVTTSSSENPQSIIVDVSQPKVNTELAERSQIDQDRLADVLNSEQNDIEVSNDDEIISTGIVFVKTDFQGLLQRDYVKLELINLEDENIRIPLIIGDVSGQIPFARDVEPVKPGYVNFTLPEGNYKIESVSIPVGTTLASEEMDVRFSVKSNSFIYLGTLVINGTKEKIKLGGVPVLKPGFEYELKVLDERQEAVDAFVNKYNNLSNEMIVDLMQIHQKLDK